MKLFSKPLEERNWIRKYCMVISLLIFFLKHLKLIFKHLFNRETDKITIRRCQMTKCVTFPFANTI